MLGTAGVCRYVRQIHVGLLAAGQLDLGLLGRFLQALHGQRVATQVDAAVFLELIGKVFDQLHVKVFAAQEGVAVGGQHFELVLTVYIGDLDDGDVEGTTAQVVNGDSTVAALLVQAISQSGCSRLVNDPLHVQTSNFTGVFGGLALAVVEVGRHGDNRFGHFLAQIVFCGFLHLLDDFRRHLRRRHLLAFHFDPGITVVCLGDLVRHHLDVFLDHVVFKATTDQTLDGVQGVVRIGDRLALGRLTYQRFTVFGIRHDGRGSAITLGVFDNLDLVAIHNGYTGVCGSQVDTNDLTHAIAPIRLFNSVPAALKVAPESRCAACLLAILAL